MNWRRVIAWDIAQTTVLKARSLPQSKFTFVPDGELVLPEFLTTEWGFHGFTEGVTRQYTDFAEVSEEDVDIEDLAIQNVRGFWGEQFDHMAQPTVNDLLVEHIAFIQGVYADISGLPIGTIIQQVAVPGNTDRWFKVVPDRTAGLKLSWGAPDISPDYDESSYVIYKRLKGHFEAGAPE